MGPADATLTEVLDCLDTTWLSLRDSVLNDRHLLWIGSGISRERFPGLPALLEKLFEVLHAAQNPADPDCPYFEAATRIVGDFSHVHGLDLRRAPAAWPPDEKYALFGQLSGRYAEVLGVSVYAGGVVRDIPFDILKLEEIYSASAATPDAEHRLLALMIAEGAITQIVTTNWDPLTERAHHALAVLPVPKVIACTAELDGAGGGLFLFKVHGCAERTVADSVRYKPHMIATHHQIQRWLVEPFFEAFRDKLRTLLRERPSLFVGISGQDFNLQALGVAARCNGPEIGFPPPRITFSGAIGAPQRHVLQAVHGESYAANQNAIESAAALPLYGKPLFGGLYVSLLFAKIRAILDAGDAQFASDEHRELARAGLVALRGFLCARFDAIPWDQRWSMLAKEVPAFIARLFEVYRIQQFPATADSYSQVHRLNPAQMAADPNLASLNLHWFCLALAALSAIAGGGLSLRVPIEPNGSDGQLGIDGPPGETSLFFPSQDITAIEKLERAGAIVTGSGRRVLFVYPSGHEPKPTRRNPGRVLPGGTQFQGPREIWFQDCALDFLNTSDLLDLLRQEVAAAHAL